MLVKSGVRTKTVKNLLKLQDKALQIINFQSPVATTNHLFLKNKVPKFADFIKYRYALFVRSSLRKEGVPLFNDMFTTTSNNHNPIIRGSVNYLLNIPQGKTIHFGDYSIRSTPSKVWNEFTDFRIVIFQPAKILNLKTQYHRSFLISIAMIIKSNCVFLSPLILCFCINLVCYRGLYDHGLQYSTPNTNHS